jgi:predicted ATP-dependent endonuclease of OLD family
LSDFVCAIGENNAGKSSLLQTLLLFINGPKLTKAEFYNPEKDVVITAHISGVTEKTLEKLTEVIFPRFSGHRVRLGCCCIQLKGYRRTIAQC